jgi:hypothetical protein
MSFHLLPFLNKNFTGVTLFFTNFNSAEKPWSIFSPRLLLFFQPIGNAPGCDGAFGASGDDLSELV